MNDSEDNAAIEEGRDEILELVQYGKDGSSFRATRFASPLGDRHSAGGAMTMQASGEPTHGR